MPFPLAGAVTIADLGAGIEGGAVVVIAATVVTAAAGAGATVTVADTGVAPRTLLASAEALARSSATMYKRAGVTMVLVEVVEEVVVVALVAWLHLLLFSSFPPRLASSSLLLFLPSSPSPAWAWAGGGTGVGVGVRV